MIPDFAEAFYYVRHPDPETAKSIFERVARTAEGAALGTGTRMEYEVVHGLFAMLPNESLQRRAQENLERVGGVVYDDEERVFAEAIRATLERVGGVVYDDEERVFAEAIRATLREDAPPAGKRCGGPAVHAQGRRSLHRRGGRELGRAHGRNERGHLGAGDPGPLLAGDRRRRHFDRREGDGGGGQDASHDRGGPLHRPGPGGDPLDYRKPTGSR